MKKTSEKAGTINEIKNVKLMFAEKQACFELLKSKVQPGKKLMIAISGGADSILTACLVYNFFIESKYSLQNLFFIHCNHKTRKGNQNDEKFIRAFFGGNQLTIATRTTHKKLAPYGATGNTETELRNRRYWAFKTAAKKCAIDQLVFGHNLTDRIESTFLNLLRGANLNGFIAMQYQETHHLLPWIEVLRPILWLNKESIFQICRQNKIPFVTDPTNKDTKTSLRNKLRNKVLPELYKLSHKQTSTTNSFIESMKKIYEQLENQSSETNIILNPISQSSHRHATFAYERTIDSKDITINSIWELAKKLGIYNNITTPLLKELQKFLQKSESGYKYFNGTYIFKAHGKIYLIAAPKFFRQKTIDSEKKIDTISIGRFPRKGDKYKGKKRNEWCINQKIPIFRRNFIPIIVKENQIIKIFKY